MQGRSNETLNQGLVFVTCTLSDMDFTDPNAH